jgi:hypothetical protein
MSGNPFDQYDAPSGSNPFDQYDSTPAPIPHPAHPNTWMDTAMKIAGVAAAPFTGGASLAGSVAGGDAAKSFASGGWGALAQVAGAVDPFAGLGKIITYEAQAAGHPLSSNVQALLPGGEMTIANATGAAYQPKTTVGKYAKAVGSMLPNAVAPEGLIPKIAAMVLPGLASEGAAQGAQALGGGPMAQGMARFAGGVVGGGLAGLAGGAPAPAAPVSITEQPAVKAIQAALDVGKTPLEDIQSSLDAGKLPVATDPGLAQLGETIATAPGAGGVAIRNAAASRMADVPDRVMGAAQSILGVDPQAARGGVDAVVAQGQAAAKPLYDAYRNTPGPMWNADLADIAARPSIKKAITTAASGLLDAGQNPTALGFKFDPDTGWELNGARGIDAVTGGVMPGEAQTQQVPTRATWDAVYKGIGQAVERNPFNNQPLSNGNNFNLDTARQALKGALTQADPTFGDALATSSDYLGVKNVFNKISGTALSGSTSVGDFSRLWNGLDGEAEQNAGKAAVANDLLEQIDKGKFAPSLFKTPGVQQKMNIAFGSGPAQAFTDQMMSDMDERGAYNKIISGSPTAGRQQLLAAYAANNPPTGLKANLQKITGAANMAASLMHPLTAVTKLADMATHTGGGAAASAGVPWENPEVTSQLGQLLSNPQAFSQLLARMQQPVPQAPNGLLNGLQYAAPGLLSGVLAPQAAQAAQGAQPR